LITDAALQGWSWDILIVMADLALLTQNDVVGILSCQGDVVLCPGRGGGTNMILIRDPGFRTCYRGLSFPKHLEFARKSGLKTDVFESFRAGCDIDCPEDLAEVLLHGRGKARVLLEKMGFSLSEKGRKTMGKSPLIQRDAPSDSRTRM
jgi:2-phospho-L-lactate guanylyltransferase